MNKPSLLKSESGSILLQVLIASGLALLVALILGQMTIMMNRQVNYAQLKMSLFDIRNNLLSTIMSEPAWKNTIQYAQNITDPVAKLCLTGTNGDVPPAVDCSKISLPLTVLDANNSVVLKSAIASAGMTKRGTTCDTFNASTGNSDCPIHIEAHWETECVSPCNMRSPPLKISVSFQYNDPNATSPINTNQLNFVLRR